MLELDWIRWWSRPWDKALDEWWPPLLKAIKDDQLQTLAMVTPNACLRAFGVTPGFPQKPNRLVLSLVDMTPEQWMYLHGLCMAVCFPREPSSLAAGQRLWCEGFAKGVRPGRWLSEGNDPFLLLKLWLGKLAWERVRLVLTRDQVTSLECQVPVETPSWRQLRIFWEPLIWQVVGAE